MDTLFSMKVFCQVVEHGSFTRAAEHLHISTAMASKHVSHLENRLSARLLHRNSRHLALTAEGERYYPQCRDALEQLDHAAAQASAARENPQGHLRITAPIWCANPAFARWMTEYRARYPDVSLDIVLDNRMHDLVGDGFDLALRVSKTPSPALIVRPLFDVRFVLVASPAYTARHGLPQNAEAAQAHHAVLPSYTDISRMSYDAREHGELRLHSSLQSNNTLMLHQLILAGGGIGYLPQWLVADDLAHGRLQQLLPDHHFLGITLHAAYPDRRHLAAKVRSFIDFMVEKSAGMGETQKSAGV
ncbi:MAG: LysR substrate-binding domain-containing protein [Cardiobacteriaceae bacterium]|nr:LysR substrate-binding domain-containing protein [Cardiobacteriaceae bacterium]